MASLISLLTIAMATASAPENPATLENLFSGVIDEDSYRSLRPTKSLRFFLDENQRCLTVPLPKLRHYPRDLSWPRLYLQDDGANFGGRFPSVIVSLFSTRVQNEEWSSSVLKLALHGEDSDEHLEAIELERARLTRVGLPFRVGRPYFSSIEEYMGMIDHLTRNRSSYSSLPYKFGFAYYGTATIIVKDGHYFAVTAAHIFNPRKGSAPLDLAVIPLREDEIASLSQSVPVVRVAEDMRDRDLIGQKLQMFFNRGCNDYQNGPPASLVYELQPAIVHRATGQLFANSPNDFGNYMGAVSGAGVFRGKELVGVFLGRECFGDAPLGQTCNDSPVESKYLRFLGIEALRSALDQTLKAESGNTIHFF